MVPRVDQVGDARLAHAVLDERVAVGLVLRVDDVAVDDLGVDGQQDAHVVVDGARAQRQRLQQVGEEGRPARRVVAHEDQREDLRRLVPHEDLLGRRPRHLPAKKDKKWRRK